MTFKICFGIESLMNELELLCHYEAKDHMADQGSDEVDLVLT